MTAPPPLWDGRAVPGRAVLDHLRSVLVAAGFTAGALGEQLPTARSGMGLLTFDPLVHGRRLDPDGPLAPLVGLLLFGEAVDEPRLRAVLGAGCLDALAACGLVDRTAGRVRSRIEVHPWEHVLAACDPSRGARHESQVLGMTPAAATLAYLAPLRDGPAALDLGAGCGVHALLAAARSRAVAATDVNPRALAFCALNAGLNGAEGVEPRRGSWFEPVAGRRFDLVLSNPPYVISPDTRFTYRDAGLPGDEVCARVVRGAAEHLADGGHATVLCNWVCRDGEPVAAAPLRWAGETDCDAVVLTFGADDPLTYAASFNAHLRDADGPAFREALDRWLAHFHRLGAAAIGSGAVVLRRRGTRGWAKALEAPGGPTGWAGEHVLRLFTAHDRLAAAGPAGLLDAVLLPAAGLRIDASLAFDPAAGFEQAPAAIGLDPGAGVAATLDPRLVGVLLRCDGRRTLRELLAETAGGQPREELAAAAVGGLAPLVERGVLLVAGDRGGAVDRLTDRA